MCELCHLHVHSEYSSLDGYIRIPELVKKVGEFKQSAIALTDHGTMSGMLDLFHECRKWNKANPHQPIKPIMGMEAYIVNDRRVKVKGELNKHLLLWARNQEGYQNLLKLHYEGYATGKTFVYDRVVPRIDHTLLTRENCRGIIVSTGCLASEFSQFLLKDQWDAAVKLVEKYKNIFDALVAEVQPPHLIDLQGEINEKIIKLAEVCDLPIICTTDSHYLEEKDREAHQLVLAIQSKRDIYDPERFTFEATHLTSTDEMRSFFDDKIIENTKKLADKCEFPHFLEFNEHGYRLPKYPIPKDEKYEEWVEGRFEDEDESYRYCSYLVEKKWGQKLRQTKQDADLEEKYRARLNTELATIKEMGFIDYFLIVWDFVNWCKGQGIMTGDGRGSAGGCLLSYLLGITKLDPLTYDLLFSRFLNRDRISLPDIDMDIDKSRRDEVKEYLAEKYGRDHVASIATFSRMKVRACIKDIVRSLRLGGDKKTSFEIADRINKTLEGESDDISYEYAIEHVPEFAKYMEEYPDVAHYAQEFEGLIRQTGIHAAGVIIGAEPLTDTIPLMVDKNGVVATAYDGVTLEKDGFLKMDLLGLKNLTIITETCSNIEKIRGKKLPGFFTKGIDVHFDEPETSFLHRLDQASPGKQGASKAYKLLRDGKTNGVFQVEGQTMRDLLKGVYVNSIEDVAAVLALCRPGPLKAGMTTEFGNRKRLGEDQSDWYAHESLKPILRKTFGILCYQEQVMRIAVQCAGFTEPESDTLRKAMGKKIHELLLGFERQFIEGCQATSGMSEAVATKLWDDVLAFASYGFNLSHAVGYAHTTFKCAYLKANYPAEFFGALLSNTADQDLKNSYIREAQNSGIRILPIDINKSTMKYEVEDVNTIRRDLASLKGVGAKAVDDILEKRPFINMVDFLSRTDSKRVTSRVIIALIRAGAFDTSFKDEKVPRKGYFDYFDDCRKKIKRYIKRLQDKAKKEGTPIPTAEECMKDFPEYDWHNPLNTRAQGRGKNRIEVGTPVARASKDDRAEWNPSEIVGFECEIYGAPVTYNVFDFHEHAEEVFKKKCDPIYCFDQSLDEYDHQDRVYMMVNVKGLLKKSPYKKDKKKYTRRFLVEDRTGEGVLTVFDRDWAANPNAWHNGNMLILQCSVNLFMNRKSIVVNRVLKNCGNIDGSM